MLATVGNLLLLAVPAAAALLTGLPPASESAGVGVADAEISASRATPLPAKRGQRQRRVDGPLKRGVHELKDPTIWPAEPASPAGPLDARRFDDAVFRLCREVAPAAALPQLAGHIRAVAASSDTDAFLLAALVYRLGRCQSTQHGGAGVGLLAIQPAMFGPEARLPFARAALDKNKLLDSMHNLTVGAALLRMWEGEHAALDRTFASTPHRTAISHFVWGDRVWGATAEDRALSTRRRLIEAYTEAPPVARPSILGFDIVSPLAGAPRLGTSGPGADRDGGLREHRGLDVDAGVGEPVRSIADGVVQFTGADMPGKQPARWLLPKGSRKWAGRRLGAGGIFVRVLHADGVRSGYFHLTSFRVQVGQTVKAGEVIGAVGRSGVKLSGSHLHFEVQRNLAYLDPVKTLEAFVTPPQATWTHDLAMADKKVRLDRERRVRRRAWLRARRISELVSPAASAPAAAAQMLASAPRSRF